MPAPAAITLTVNTVPIVFDPVSNEKGVASHVNRDSTISSGNKDLIMGMKFATGTRRTDKISIRVNEPYEFTNSDGEQQVDHVMRFQGEYIIHEDIPTAQVALFAELVEEAINHALTRGYVADRNVVW